MIELKLVNEAIINELHNLIIDNKNFLQKFLPWITDDYSFIDTQKFVHSSINKVDKNIEYQYVILCNGGVVGVIGFCINQYHCSCDIGYWIAEKFNNKGICTFAVNELESFIFTKLKINRIEIRCAESNINSNKIPYKLNYKFEGVSRQYEKNKNRYFNHKIWSKLRTEYENDLILFSVSNYIKSDIENSIQIFNHINEINFEDLHYKQPFLLKNQMNDWGCIKKWSFDYFYNNYGFVKVNSSIKEGESISFKKTTIKEFIANNIYSFDYSDKLYSIHSWLFEKDIPLLLEDYKVLEIFENWFSKMEEYIAPKLKFIFLGSSNSGTTFHIDPLNTSAWNGLIKGKKIWFFFPPDVNLNFDNLSIQALIDCNFYNTYKPKIIIQNKGDIIYIPSLWYHAVYNLENYIALSENFVNKTNIMRVNDFFKKNEQYPIYKILHNFIKKQINNF
jgi:RimJ/RimL family protein N-acetyltransferase